MSTPLSFDGSVALAHLGVIRARGADSSKFLHGQLTNDFSLLGLSQARLAGFCSAKGRLQASFVAWKLAHDDVLLLCSASVLPATLKRLSMFVLRLQCKLSDATAELTPYGVVGPTADALLARLQVWEKREVEGASLVRLPDVGGLRRGFRVGGEPLPESQIARLTAGAKTQPTSQPMAQPMAQPTAQPMAQPTAPSTAAPTAPPALTLEAWRWLEAQSGLPTIEAATVDQFVPQMLNYELIGGVDFKKGCYPGQEIVARSQYRGTIKRRMFLFDCDVDAAAGQEVFHSADPDQPAGMVANAAPRPGAVGSSLLVEVKLAALQDGSLHLGSAQGALLRRADMPYEVTLEAA